MQPTLSHFQVKGILAAKEAGETAVSASLDLGKTTAVLPLTSTHVILPDGQQLDWVQLAEIVAKPNNCFTVANNDIEKIKFFTVRVQPASTL